LPPWDLQLVLQGLTGPLFEPMAVAPLKFVTLKTVFLLGLASGSRRSEIHAWTKRGVRFSADKKSVYLAACSTFLAKNQSASVASTHFEPVVVPALAHTLERTLSDRTLCPIRALKYYTDRSESVRKDQQKLFVSFKAGFVQEIRPATISSWLKTTIKLAYENLKPDDAQACPGHSREERH